MKIDKVDKFVLAAGVVSALVAAVFLRTSNVQKPIAPKLLPIASNEVIGSRPAFRGSSDAPYTLVEFADYECPPCKLASTKLTGVLAQYKQSLRLTYRQYPLSLHKNAIPAALASEAARVQGKFWQMHDELFTMSPRLTQPALDSLALRLKLDHKKFISDINDVAKKALDEDNALVKRLNLLGTPSFVLCCPDGRVFLLSSLGQLADFIR